MKTERSNVNYPLWRKKVDLSLFNHKGTTIPTWACSMWDIQKQFSSCISKKDPKSEVTIRFNNNNYDGWVTIATKKRVTPAYRLWYTKDLLDGIKDAFPMSFMRDIESRLRKSESKDDKKKIDIEKEIPFWEFLDIEYDNYKKQFIFTPYYVQTPQFPQLFKHLIGSPMLHRIDDELMDKGIFRIYQQDWKPRNQLETQLGANNVIYYLLDTKNKLLYIGEATELIKRVSQSHHSIPYWDFFRYDCLPMHLEKHRQKIERMMIKIFAFFIDNKQNINYKKIQGLTLANDKIV